MKKILLLGAIALSLNSFGQVPAYVPTNGLVGWWPFNGNAIDESANTNDGTVNGATLTTDRFGNLNKAYSFNGVDNYIEITNSSSLNPLSITLAGWVNSFEDATDVQSNAKAIITKWYQAINCGNASDNYNLQLSFLNNNSVLLGSTTQNNQSVNSISSINNIIGLNTWHHFAFIHDNLNGQKLFIDGIQINSNNIAGDLCNSTNNLLFGADNFSGTNFWRFLNGKLDDIGIWNRELTECEIQDLYSSQLNSTSVSAGSDQTICNGDAITLSASGSMNYSWDNGITDGIAFNPTSTQVYIVDADSAGCISSDVVTITVNQTSTSTINETATDTYTSPSGMVYTTSGVYNDTILNSNQCDSIITINLTIEYTGIDELSSPLVSIYPNPSSDNFKIIGIEKVKNIKTFEITSITGARVAKRDIYSSVIDISFLDKGIYLFVISHENGTEKIRFIKD